MSSELPETGGQTATAQSFESYGKLLALLLPRMRNFAVHDAFGNSVWATPYWNVEVAGEFVRQTIAAAMQDQGDLPALGRAIDTDRALYSFALRNDLKEILAVVSLEVMIPPSHGGARPVDTLRPFVQPAIECLRRELILRQAPQFNPQPEIEAILRHGIHHVGCGLAAFWAPARLISLSLTPSGKRMPEHLLRMPQQMLLQAMQKTPRTLVLNHSPVQAIGSSSATLYKILACPLTGADGHIAGILALFNPPSAPDFVAAQAHAAERCFNRIVQFSFENMWSIY